MRRLVQIACTAWLLGACVREPSPIVVASPAPEPPAPETIVTPAPEENPDAVLWYAPPVPAARVPMTAPAIEDTRLANGMRIVVLPRRDIPLVAVHVILRWHTAVPRLHGIQASLLLRSTPAGRSRVLREEFFELGVHFGASSSHDTSVIACGLTSQVLDEALGLVFDTLKGSTFTPEALDAAREEHLRNTADGTPRGPLMRRLQEGLFPAGHPYHEPHGGSPEDVKKLEAGELQRYRDAQLRPEIVTLVVVGDVTPSKVVASVSQLSATWKPTGPAPSTKRAALQLARVVLLADVPEADRASVALVVPIASVEPREELAARMAWWIMAEALFKQTKRSEDPGKHWKDMWIGSLPRRDINLHIAFARLPAESAAPFATAVLGEMDRMAKGEITDEELGQSRRAFTDHVEGAFDGVKESAFTLGEFAAFGDRLDMPAVLHRATLEMRREDLARVATTYFQKQHVRVVALGNSAALKVHLGKLDLGPVSELPTAPAGKTN
jgi:predicted Zn-dependent peptidase